VYEDIFTQSIGHIGSLAIARITLHNHSIRCTDMFMRVTRQYDLLSFAECRGTKQPLVLFSDWESGPLDRYIFPSLVLTDAQLKSWHISILAA
jgi:hypothetical protein